MCKETIKSKHPKGQNQEPHNQEHEQWTRRSFLSTLGIGGASTLLGHSKKSMKLGNLPLIKALLNSESDRVLVILRMKGGNDGLNTIVPLYDFDTYQNVRPTLAHKQADLIPLDSDFAMPNYMSDLEGFWNEGKMKVINNVGYSEPNLSHFTSSEIWAAANENIEDLSTGLMGRYFDEVFPDYFVNPPLYPPMVVVGQSGNLIMKGANANVGISFSTPDSLQRLVETGSFYDVENVPECYYGEQLAIARNLVNSTTQFAIVLKNAYDNASNAVDYHRNLTEDFQLKFASQLAVISRLIKGGLSTKVYMIELDGFDNHEGQADWHPHLMKTIGLSLKNFYQDLEEDSKEDKVLTMTISEFGRRIYENGSQGTDHGAAAPMMLFGGTLHENPLSMLGSKPDLQNPDQHGSLRSDRDFRDVYRAVLEGWLCVDGLLADDLFGKDVSPMGELGITCGNSLPINTTNKKILASHHGYFKGNHLFIEYDIPYKAHVFIECFDIQGRVLGNIKKDTQSQGHHIESIMMKNHGVMIVVYVIHVNGIPHSGKVAFF